MMFAGIYWDWVWTVLIVWLLGSAIPLAIFVAILCVGAAIYGGAYAVCWLLEWKKARARANARKRAERAK